MKEHSATEKSSDASASGTTTAGLATRILSFLASQKARIFPIHKSPVLPLRQAYIGENDGRIRVIAFSAGGTDNIFEFGMVHAFLVSDAPPPHIIAGTSSGAAAAAALAEVLQAGDARECSTESGKATRRLAQVARFRALLDQIQRVPEEFREAALPDLTEVSARAGLEPLDSPIQQADEKEDRKETALARFGLTRLFNGMLSSHLKVAELARIVRLWLDFQAAGEWRMKKLRRILPRTTSGVIEPLLRVLARSSICFRIWMESLLPSLRDAPLLLRCVLAPWREWLISFHRIRNFFERVGFARLRKAKAILFEPWWLQSTRRFLFLLSYPTIVLAWLFAPPALILWLAANRAFRCVPKGKRRDTVLRVAGFALLAVAFFIMFRTYHEIPKLWQRIISGINVLPRVGGVLDHNKVQHIVHEVCGLAFDLGKSWFAIGTFFAATALVWGATPNGGELWAKFLAGFNIKKDLLTTGVLHRLFMRAFDPAYFGQPNFEQAVNEVLGGAPACTSTGAPHQKQSNDLPAGGGPRKLSDWIWRARNEQTLPPRRPILVAPLAVDVANGKLVTLQPDMSIIDALTAACALSPWFAPFRLAQKGHPDKWLVDAACVAREPIKPVMDLIKRLHLNRLGIEARGSDGQPFAGLKLAADPNLVEVCVISPLPTKRLRERERAQMKADMLPKGIQAARPVDPPRTPGILHQLADIFSLKATHAAKDERTIVNFYNAALSEHQRTKGAIFCSSLTQEASPDINDWHVYAALREIEPSEFIRLHQTSARCATEAAKRSLVLRIIADGCRESLSALYRNKLIQLAQEADVVGELEVAEKQAGFPADKKTPMTPPCRKLQESFKGLTPLPGILEKKSPPGIAEICKECKFYNATEASWKEIEQLNPKHAAIPVPLLPDWAQYSKFPDELLNPKLSLPKIEQSKNWPLERAGVNGFPPQHGKTRPTVSIILSGGVFRGVFQVGVLNALCQAGLRPDVVAGASVGTIMAAFSARLFTEDDPQRRHRRMASIAATFLAIDRLVLTDRFADFIRRFTLRAGAADFSLRDADHLFRRFDRRNWDLLTRRSRRVLAGLHRLAYLDPVELLDLLSFNKPDKRSELLDRLILYAQEALNRAGIGSELLGAEPLERLIKAHVLGDDQGAEFDEFLGSGGIHFLATTTNLTTGEQDVLGSFCNSDRRPALVPGLLASSAFPGVFRPRMNWELRAASPGLPEELVDGGIADNLPLIPVYRFLFYAGHAGWLALRPKPKTRQDGETQAVPHLLFTASLEPQRSEISGDDLKRTAECWPELKRRIGQLKYNVKVDSHRQTQDDLRQIHTALAEKQRKVAGSKQEKGEGVDLLDLHVSCVKPAWLCGTFAFHPMLGFTRDRQARSIAHGCASTLAHLHCEQLDHHDWTPHWWSYIELFDGACNRTEPTTANGTADIRFALNPHPANSCGDCCFVRRHKCPFSKHELSLLDPALPKETVVALDEIYRLCGQATTHRAPEQ
jgi:predicted acylesterase/phospholipase RssA